MKRKEITGIIRRICATCVSPRYVKMVKRLGAKRLRQLLKLRDRDE